MVKFNFIMIIALCLISTPLLAGNLEPTAAPGSTMKPLSDIDPGTAINSLPYTINTSGSYYLTANCTASSGIQINTDNVTIDLRGFTLDGNKAVTHAITASKKKNIILKNGIIVNWYACGLYLYDSNNCRIENLSFSNIGYAAVGAGNNSIIRNCAVINCRSNSYAAISAGVGAVISDCVVSDCNYIGIKADKAVISNCSVKKCVDVGMMTTDTSTIKNCLSVSNGDYGLQVSNGSIVEGCTAIGNTGYGMSISSSTAINNNCSSNTGSGMFITGTGCHIESNSCNSNTAYGFYISSTSNSVIRNFARLNTSGGYSVTTGGGVAPVTNTYSSATEWSNFSF